MVLRAQTQVFPMSPYSYLWFSRDIIFRFFAAGSERTDMMLPCGILSDLLYHAQVKLHLTLSFCKHVIRKKTQTL